MSDLSIIEYPTVYLLSKQTIQQNELDRFLADHEVTWSTDSEVGAEVVSEVAGRVCYMSFAKPRPGGNSAYLSHIKEVGHGSVTEHAVWTFLLTGISRSLTHELVRHRAGWAYSQLSQRYVDESVAEAVVPPDLRKEITKAETHMNSCCRRSYTAADVFRELEHVDDPKTVIGLKWIYSILTTYEQYRDIADYQAEKANKQGLVKTEARKFARQSARSVLPNATETKITVTVNARALRHFFEQRGSRFADPEIRNLAVAVFNVAVKDAPNLFGDYKKVPLPDGTCELTTEWRKV